MTHRSRRAGTEPVLVSKSRALEFSRALRRWFRAESRDLPWRRTRDPYQVLVSELMLQQTQVSRVILKYGEFLDRFPTLGDVARARPKRVMEAWEGLGYYARARNLHSLARRVTGDGTIEGATLPSDPGALRALPGIGPYTAGAVASFAYERRAALVDTNVGRVLNRVFAPQVDRRSSRGAKVIWAIAEQILPRTGSATWTHNQALMGWSAGLHSPCETVRGVSRQRDVHVEERGRQPRATANPTCRPAAVDFRFARAS